MTETVQEMIDVVDKVLDDRELSKMVVRRILDYFGGMQVYLPKTESAFREEIDEAIYQAFNGHNHKEVVRSFDITIQRLYEIIRAKRSGRNTTAQGRLDFE